MNLIYHYTQWRICEINYRNIEELASELLSQGIAEVKSDKQETYLRSATSRAYYSSFILARDKMIFIKQKSNPNYQPPMDGKIHKNVQKFWEKKFRTKKSKSSLLRHLKSLRIQRNKADYNLSIRHSKMHASKS